MEYLIGTERCAGFSERYRIYDILLDSASLSSLDGLRLVHSFTESITHSFIDSLFSFTEGL